MKSPASSSHQLAAAVTAVEISRIFLWPNMSPSFARIGTTRADSSSCAASNQLKSASLSSPRCVDEVGDQRHVVALQDAARQLDEDEEPDEADRDGSQ